MRKASIGLAGLAVAAILVFAAVRFAASGHRPVGAGRLGGTALAVRDCDAQSVPLGPTCEVTAGQAQQTALKQEPGGTVLQTVLAELVLTNPSASKPRLCWVVSMPGSLIASYGPPGSRKLTAT